MLKSYRKAVMAVFVNDTRQVLIGYSPRDGGFKFPQGGFKPHEKPIRALQREMREELGVHIKEDDIVQICAERVKYNYTSGDDSSSTHVGQEQMVMKIRYNKSMRLKAQDDEFKEMVWISPKDLKKYDTQHRKEAYKRALELCGLL